MQVTSEQLRAARALLRLEQADVARRAAVSIMTIRRIEAGTGSARVAPAILADVRQALEQAGAEFIKDGVRRRTEARPDTDALFDALRHISVCSAERLRAHQILTDADLYDENGLPA